jgi:hypothetical protein
MKDRVSDGVRGPEDPEGIGGPEGTGGSEGTGGPEGTGVLESARDPEGTGGPEDPRHPEGARDPGDPRDPEDARDMKDAKGGKAPQNLGDPKEPKDPEGPRDPEDARDMKDTRGGKGLHDLGDPKEPKDPKGLKDEPNKVAPESQDKTLAQRIFGGRGQEQNPQTDRETTRAPKGVRGTKTVSFDQPTKDAYPLWKEQARLNPNMEQNSGDQSVNSGPANDPQVRVQPAKGMPEKDGSNKSPANRSSKETLSIYWLSNKNMLRKVLPGARVLKFGYPATPGLDGDQVTLDRAAEKLRSRLLILRNDCRNRPIVFIGRDVGVVVIEQALIQISRLPEAEEVARHILESTTGIIFLATPSPGADSRDYFTGRDDWFPPKSTTSTASPSTHLHKFKRAVERKNIFLARLQWPNKTSGSDDTNYSQVSGLVRRFENSHRFLTAAFKQERDTVEGLLDQGVDSNVQNRSGQSALHIAVRNDDFPMVRLLLGKGSADIALQDNKGQSALHIAVQRALRFPGQRDELPGDKFKVVELLLAKGADAKALDRDGRSATNLADFSQNKEIKSLLEKPPLVEGPSASITHEWRKPMPPDDPNAVSVCENFRATLTEFFLIKGRENRIIDKHASVYEVLYEQGPESILNHDRPSTLRQTRTCRWFHLPANNVSEKGSDKYRADGMDQRMSCYVTQSQRLTISLGSICAVEDIG